MTFIRRIVIEIAPREKNAHESREINQNIHKMYKAAKIKGGRRVININIVFECTRRKKEEINTFKRFPLL